MKEFIDTQWSAARSLAGIAREVLAETREAAVSRVWNVRSQVEDLWEAAADMIPQARPAALMDRVNSALEVLRHRDTIGFPVARKA